MRILNERDNRKNSKKIARENLLVYSTEHGHIAANLKEAWQREPRGSGEFGPFTIRPSGIFGEFGLLVGEFGTLLENSAN